MNHNIISKKIDQLIEAEYNPRQLTKDQYQNIKDSIQRFGIVDPIIINKNKDRKNIIIGGHQRVKIAKRLNMKEVPCLEIDLPYEKERELNVRLNKNNGEFDFDLLSNHFELDELIEWGFDAKEFNMILDLPKDDSPPELEICEELLEEHDYIVFYFDNTLDWNVAKEIFNIKKEMKHDTTATYKNIGLGRVKSGKELLKIVNK